MKHRKLNSKRSTPESQVEYVDEEFDAIKLDVTHSESLSDSDDNNENDNDNPQSSNTVMNVERIGNEQSIMKCCSNDDDNLKAECGEMNQQPQPSLDFAVEPCFEDENPSYEKDDDTNNQNQNELFTTFKSKLKRISQKVFHCICPLARPCAALIRCDMQTFWNILPSIVVIKALWLSYLCMVFCDLAKVVRLIPTEVQSNNGPIHVFQKEQYSFGLWGNDSMMNEQIPYSNTPPSERQNWKNTNYGRNLKSLTVSRLSPKTLDWFESNKSLKLNVSLVISHCDKSVGPKERPKIKVCPKFSSYFTKWAGLLSKRLSDASTLKIFSRFCSLTSNFFGRADGFVLAEEYEYH